MNLRNVVILVLATCLCGSVPFVQGQGTDLGTIRGIVSDASGSVVPDATIIVTDTETGAARLTKTHGDGEYEVFGLRPGSYKIVLNRAGFAAQEIDSVVVQGSSVVGVNATLRVSSAEEKIEVTVGVPEIDTENPTISNTINSRAIIDLPRDIAAYGSVVGSTARSRSQRRRWIGQLRSGRRFQRRRRSDDAPAAGSAAGFASRRYQSG